MLHVATYSELTFKNPGWKVFIESRHWLMKISRALIVFTCSLFFAAHDISAANLLSNGSFEAPAFANAVYYLASTNNDLPGWTVSGSSSRNVAIHKTPDVGAVMGSTFNSAKEGNYYLDLSGNGTNHPTISAGFTTWQGFRYQLSFWYGAAVTNAPDPTINVYVRDETTNVNVTLASLPATNGAIVWSYYSVTWIAHANGTGLYFHDTSTNDDNAGFIDDVRVTPYPAQLKPFRILSVNYDPFPAPGWLITWQSQPSFTYQVLYKNSLNDPQWTPLSAPFQPPLSPNYLTTSYKDTSPIAGRIYQVAGW
jgi:hypothetical protein